MKRAVGSVAAILVCIALGLAPVRILAADDTVTGDKGTDAALDLLIVRPAGVVATAVGAAIFVIGLPFSIAGGNVEESAKELIGKPAEYTLNRPLGEFRKCGADRHPCGLP